MPFRCDHCDQGFYQGSTLRRHKRTHTGEKPFKFQRCDKSYRQSGHLIDHQRVHTGERPYKYHNVSAKSTVFDNPCSIPITSAMEIETRSRDSDNQTVNYPISVSDHFTGHRHVEYDSEEDNYSSTFSEVDLQNIGHVPVSHRLPSVSEYGKHYDHYKLKKQHTSATHSAEDTQLLADFPQDHTSLSQETRVSLDRQHIMRDRANSQTREQPHSCKYCKKSFPTQSRLTSHECVQPEKKTFKCKVCDKTFSRRYHLVRHGRVHSGEKPFMCKYCAKSFSEKSSCTVHERIHTGKKPFGCDHCGQGFCDSSNLIRHKRTHTEEKQLKCTECKKAFRRSSHLADHQRAHTGEKPFKCKVCGKSFRWKTNLAVHERIYL
ncbi:zinc finger protein 493-like [Sycon ciliatum]|uniref:zinc finger protein 493-like n=1 Tax=Sycon ciliatum TaxID=27933 RepID=UPI0031F6DDA3